MPSFPTFPPSSNPIYFTFKIYLNPLELHDPHSSLGHYPLFSRLPMLDFE